MLLKAVFGVLFGLVFLPQAAAQQTKVYQGPYEALPGHSGDARFHYREGPKGEKVKEGPFFFTYRTLDTACNCRFSELIIEGSYANNMKVGPWKYRHIQHDVRLDGVRDYKPEYNINSTSTFIEGQFADNMPSGQWKLESGKSIGGYMVEKHMVLEGDFDKAKLHGQVSMEGKDKADRPFSVKGHAHQGLMEGEWVLEYFRENKPIREIRWYQKGFLIRMAHLSGRGTLTDTVMAIEFPLSARVKDLLEGRSQNGAANAPLSVTFSDGYPRTSHLIEAQRPGNQIISDGANMLFGFEANFAQTYGLPIGTNRMIYPLNDQERQALKEWPEVEYAYRKQINALNDSLTAYFRYSKSDEVAVINAWVTKQLELLEYTRPWNVIFSRQEIQYYYRSGTLLEYAWELLERDTLRVPGRPEVVVHYPTGEASNFLYYIVHNFRVRTQVADSVQKVFAREITKLQWEAQVAGLRDAIHEKKEAVDSLYATLAPTHPVSVKVNQTVRSRFMDSLFTRLYDSFNKAPSVAERRTVGNELVYSLDDLLKIPEKAHIVTRKRVLFDTLYTGYKFDPFTFDANFPIRIKPRLYNAGENLYNCLIAYALTAQSPQDMLIHLQRADRLMDRLIFLADKDTKKLERQLKPRLTVEQKLELLKVE